MRLLYLYIQSFRCFRPEHPLEINFTTDFRFALEKGLKGRRLVCHPSEKPLPKNFFGINGAESVVTEVSAIVGENGSGKSSLALFLQRMRMVRVKDVAFLIVYEEESDKSWRWHCSLRDVTFPDLGASVKEGYVWKKSEDGGVLSIEEILKQDFDYVYYSPYFSDQQLLDSEDDDPSCVNLSTRALVEKRPEYVLNKAISRDDGEDRTLRSYLVEQKIWELTFASEYVKWDPSVKQLIDIHSPRNVFLRPYADMAQVSIAVLEKIASGDGSGAIPTTAVKIANNAIGLINVLFELRQDVFFGTLLVFVANYFRSLVSSVSAPGFQDDAFGDALIPRLILAMRDASGSCIDKANKVVDVLGDVENLESPLLDANGRAALCRYFKKVKEFCVPFWPKIHPGNISFEMEHFDDHAKDLFALINDHSLSAPINPYIEVSFDPPMSSGESAFLSMLGRLYWHFTNSKSRKKDVLLFLDEAETTLHPEWQQRLVSTIILFLNNVAKDARVHVIFATHSPMLLSDIPIGNAIFLRRSYENEAERTGAYSQQVFTEDSSIDYSNSFGAHVVDLLGNSFFLSKGSIGFFARKKIQEAINGVISKEDAWIIVQMIGDPFLRQVARDSI